jgi:hypothetical protein
LLGYKQQLADAIGQDTVNLFRHCSVNAAKTGFDVNQFYAQFNSYKAAGDGAVDIADDQRT